ncbi:MAG: hypothetical protein ACKV1O_20560 [Saprospiraceae bacterium]
MRIILSFGFLLIFTTLSYSQTASEALRFSYHDGSGISTARSLGVGGAMSALGSDFSVVSTNPAGLGWYRRSEFVITPSLAAISTESQLLESDDALINKERLSKLGLSNLGFVVSSSPTASQWTTFNFGIGLNQLANFNQRFYFDGQSVGSIINRFQELANGSDGLDDFESGLAYDAEALYDFDEDGFYDSDVELRPNALIYKEQTVTTSGSINELTFAFAGSYSDKLLMGVTIGVPFLNYNVDKIYKESDQGEEADGNIPFFDDLEFTESLNTTGIGINLKAGLIYRPIQAVRLGLAVHTPTAYGLNDTYRNTMTYFYTDNGGSTSGDAESPDGLFDYKFRSPWRIIGGLGVIIGKAGFLSGEVEWADYTGAQFRYSGFEDAERDVNNDIVNQLQAAANIRLGGELSFEIFRLRAGFGLHQSPIQGDDTVNQSISAGFGIREKSFFLDLGYRHYLVEETYTPYVTSEAPMQFVNNDVANGRFLLSVGFRF